MTGLRSQQQRSSLPLFLLGWLAIIAIFSTPAVFAQAQTYSIGGRVTDVGGGLSGVTVTLSGSQSGSQQTDSGGNFSFSNLVAGGNYEIVPSSAVYFFNPESASFSGLNSNFTVSFTATPRSSGAAIQFSAATFFANEGDSRATVTVTRTGDAAGPVAVGYLTVDNPAAVRCDDSTTTPGVAYARCDYATSIDTLSFAAGQTQRTFTIPLIDDAHVESNEMIQLRLSDAQGIALGAQSTATVQITDNDTAGASNPVFSSPFFVRMQYLDFLSREPDQGGFDAWLGVLNRCSNVNDNPDCDRIHVSSSFFRSDEFQLKGLYVYLFYKVSFGAPRPTYAQIITDLRSVTGTTTTELNQKRAAFADSFAARPEFRAAFDGFSNSQYVDALLNRYNVQQITTEDPANPDGTAEVTLSRQQLVDRLLGIGGVLSRAQVLRAVVQSREVEAVEFNGTFVAMQYYGYLRRGPDEEGYQAWLRVLNNNPADFRVMVNGFMNSEEYRLRFGDPNRQ